ncbi:hypothetical protein [Mycobacteroides franklinii]|uniref:Serine/threonine-protein kinase n=1 Tax=Mycobacteroides franklinii TaxID=948102 RepID=A0A4R5P6D7_9MYCO|nr:hypothetical protein [Mycobacteroides franklinii]ORA62097.1 hypothetical protein BST24_08080 [Mycobacteroides franklinii]TDH18899.1 hypothetical protein EJ571_20095 [Mycobacteroides franklinii]TDZ41649.1 hypothetical protein CCUG64054_01680 [Mycobacteroides franklinii]TDZ47074.1 hypothetical protein CCUG63697_04851 [Mycobacteroides franklinii]TDZ55203.1 hypothetical protein CCUG63696_01682 [Mycobacteroides franklinii]
MDPDIGAGSPASEDSSDAADTAPLPVLNALPGMLSEPGPFAPSEQDFGQPPFLEQQATPDLYAGSHGVPPSAPYMQWPSHDLFGDAAPISQPVKSPPTVDFSSWEDKPERSKRPLMIGGAVLAAVVVVGGVVAVFASRGGDDTPAEPTAAPPTTTVSSRDADAETRLLSMLPTGYAAAACKAVEPANEAVAQIKCGRSEDPDGPLEASYSLVKDKSALAAGLSRLTKRNAVVVCPGRIQSPGPWRRNATPDQVSGTVFCGSNQGHPVVAWTDEDRLLLSETRSGASGPTLDQLYAWWSSHS